MTLPLAVTHSTPSLISFDHSSVAIRLITFVGCEKADTEFYGLATDAVSSRSAWRLSLSNLVGKYVFGFRVVQ